MRPVRVRAAHQVPVPVNGITALRGTVERMTADRPHIRERHRLHDELLGNIRARLPELEMLLEECSAQREDLVYRFWHQSLKVYALQENTERIRTALEGLAPAGCTLHPWFREIVTEGTGKVFALSHNDDWLVHTRPIVEAFHHASYVLEMTVLYGSELTESPALLPSGWAALLEVFGIR